MGKLHSQFHTSNLNDKYTKVLAMFRLKDQTETR